MNTRASLYLLLLPALALAWSAPAAAAGDTRYISDQVVVRLRERPCDTCKVVHPGLVTGTAFTFREEAGGWSHIVTTDGVDGWLPSRYVVSEAPPRARVLEQERELEALRQDNKALTEQVAVLNRTNADIKSQLDQFHKIGEGIGLDPAALANALALRQQNEELLKRNKMLQSEVDVLAATKDRLEGNYDQRWFFYGGLAVFMGALLAILLPRLKGKRRGYSEWG